MNIIELFSSAKDLQQAASAKVGEEMEVVTINSEVECSHECNSTLRSGGLVPSNSSSAVAKKMVTVMKIIKSLMKGMMKTKIASRIMVKI